jgi:hypothetical protein
MKRSSPSRAERSAARCTRSSEQSKVRRVDASPRAEATASRREPCQAARDRRWRLPPISPGSGQRSESICPTSTLLPAGGWSDTRALKMSYQHLDELTMYGVFADATKLRDVNPDEQAETA